MGCCHSKPARNGSHQSFHQQVPVPPDVNGTSSASFAPPPEEVKLRGGASDEKRSDGLLVENNNLAAPGLGPSVGVDAFDGTRQPTLVSTIGIQTENNWYPQDSSGKMPFLNSSSRPAVVGMEDNMGLENLGFQGSSTSLIHEPRTDSLSMTSSLDERQKTLVRNTWKTLEKKAELHGSMMFAKLTSDHPDIGKLFSFGGRNLSYGELLVDPDVRAHGRRVIDTLGSVVEDLDDMELVIQILEDLGQRHNSYNAKKTHIKAVGEALLFTIEQALEAGFTSDVKAAWITVFNIVADTMSTKLSDGPLTTREQEIVRKTWGVLSLDTEQHGAAMFAKLISVHPVVAHLFPFGENLSYSQLVENPTLRGHGRKVMETIGQAVGALDNLDILVPILRDLARRHIGYNVTRQHFQPVGEALMHAIREGLGRSFSEEVEGAWLAVFELVVDTMADMLPEGSKEIFSPTQKRLIQETWKKLSRDPERHGSVMFAKLATSHPEVGKVFPFGGKGLTYEQLLRNHDVKAHGRRVFETVGQAVNGLDDLDLLFPTLKDLAQRHTGYNVQKRYFAPTGDAFLHAVKLGVGPSSFTSDVRNAWAALFKVVTDTMAEVVPDGPITATQKSLVQTSWKTIGQDPTRHGSVLFAKLITDNPNVGKLFPFGSMNLTYEQLLTNNDLRAHGKRIMGTIGVAVSGLDDLELLIPILQDLAKRHVGYNVTKQHFKPVGGALIHALRVGLGSRFTSELEAAWSTVFSVIAETMSPLLPAGGLTTEQKNLIKGSWRIVAPEKAKCGAVLFAKLVTDHPHIGRLFPFGSRNQSYQSLLMDDKVKAQGLLVMQTIGDAIRVLDNPDKLLPVLTELGKRHVSYGVTKSDFAPIGTALMSTLKETLGNSFNDNTKNAWLIFWQLIEETISEELVGAPDNDLITSNQKEIVQRTWKTLGKDPGRHGAVMFARLVTDHPEVGHLFPFGDRGMTYHQLLWDDSVKAHGKKVMQTVGHAVDGLNNLDLLVPILQDLAKRHIEYSVNKKQFEAVGKALMYAIEKGLGNTFDNETKGAWMAVFALVVNTMSEILPDSKDEQGPLTREQRKLVQTTWKKLATNHTKHGAVMFAKLVTDNPDVGHLFSFGNKNLSYQQLLRDPQAQAHGKRVMETVGTAVAGLDDLNILVPILQELATRHIGYRVTKQHFKSVGAALIHAIKEGLGSSFSPSIQSAWVATFELITNTMSEILPNIAPPTSAQKEIVKRTWRTLAPNPAKHGAVMFAKLVTDNPDVGHLFPFGSKNLSYQQLLRDSQAQAHGKRVMETVGTAVEGLDDLDILVPILRELATRHIGYNVTKLHFSLVGAALIHAIKEGLGSSFSPDIQSAWMAVFQLITNTMSEILPSVGPPTSTQKDLVKQTWRTLAPNPAKHGAVMFAKLVTDNPDVGHLFPFGNKNLSYQQLQRDPQAQAHGKRVMETVGTAVDGLDDLDILVPILHELATRHIGYNVTKKHFKSVGAALLHAVKEGLGSSFSPDIQSAWAAVFQLVTNTMSEILPSVGPPTSAQKEMVKRTWRTLASNPAKHGAVMFAKLVTDNPDVGHLFPFGSKNLSYQQLLRDPQAQAHGKRVMETVGTAVDGLDDLDVLVPILRELATRHIGYNVTKHHFSLVGAALIHAIKEGLGSSFSPDIQSAWVAIFQLITNTMSEILPSVGPPTSAQKDLVKRTWQTLAPSPAKHGAVMFAKLITDNPDVGHLFPFGSKNLSYQQLLRDPQAQAHGKRVMETVGTAVDGLDDLDVLVPILRELATRHIGYNVTKKHFKSVGAALIHAIKEGLGSSFSPDIQSAWVTVFQLITNTMSEILPSVGPPTPAQKEMVKRTWRTLAPNPAKHGAVMFAKLVTDNPDVGHLFPFGSKSLSYQQLLRDPQAQAHGKRVMETVGTAVGGLDDLDILVPILRELATRHIGYKVTKKHFNLVGAALIHTIKEGLGSSFSPDIQSAWVAVFQLITNTMSEILPDIGPPTSAQKEMVKRTWRTLAPNPAKHGAVMFAKLVTDNPDVGHLFPFGSKNLSYQQLLRDPQAQAHGKRVMETVGTAVDGLDDLDILVPILRELATRHIGYKVTNKHFKSVGAALIHAIKEGLGSSFSPSIQSAWVAVFQLIINTMSEILPSVGPPTSAQKELVKRTWRTLASNPAKHGAVMFAKLVTDNPDVGHLFPFGSKNLSYQQLLRDPQAQAHGKRVMETVGTAVDGLDDLDVLVPILRELATRHIGYNVTKHHFSLVGAALIHAIKEGLGSSFSPDIQSAWVAIFQLITNTMSEILPSVGPPTSAQKDLVKRTWQTLAPSPAKHGAVMFAKLITDNPDVGHLFPFGSKNLSYQQLLRDPQAQAHGKRVMETVGTAVDGLDDLDVLVPILSELATRHIGYNVTKKHFKSVGAALIHAIKEGLGSSFSPDIQSAWVAVFQLITNTMSEILPSVGPPTSAQKEMVKRTWRTLAPNPAKHGAVMFAKLVTDNPDVGHLFPFGSKNLSYQQLLRDPQAQAHGKRVMEIVGTAVDGLDDLDILVPILRELATRHIGYKVTKQHFSSVGAALIHAIREGLGSTFSPDIQSAWVAVFQLITNTMSEILSDIAPPTSEQKELVKRTWLVLAPNPSKHGAVMFAKLLTRHPTVGKLFPFGKQNLSYAQLLKHSQVLAHGKKVMEMVGAVVDGIHDLDLLVPILRDLGGRHVGYGVNKELFEPVEEVLLETIKEALGSSFTDEVRQAWAAIFKIVSHAMSEALSKGSITAEHKRLVQETWRKLATDPAKNGATMFAKLVTDYPAVGPLLPFGDEGLSYDELLVDPRVRAHGTRVMQTVGSAVDGLNDISSVVPVLQELATRHISYGVTKQHFSPAVSSLMHAIRQGLGRDYNGDVEKAWLAVLQVVVDTMSAELPDGTLDDAKKDLVRETWAILSRNPEQHGAVMFAKLVTDNPAIGRLFPFGKKNLSYDQLLADSQAKSHGRRVMETVGHAVSGLDDLDLLVPVLEELAQRHHQYGVTKNNFKPVGKALMHAIEEGLGQRFSSEVEDAWRAVFTVITNTMSRILPDHIILTDETKRLVRESWRILSTDPGKHGAVMFARLTTQNPIVGRLFPYGDQNLSYGQLLSNRKVRAHGTKVMETIGLAVDNLDNVDDLVTVLKDLALRHTQYNVTKMHFEPTGQALMFAIKEGLGSSFTSKVKDAWSLVFQLISETMSEVLPEGPISFDHIEVLKRTWKVLGQNPEQHGTVVFAKLASDHSLVSSLFPFGGKGLTYEQLLQNDDVRKHGRQFMATVGSAIDNLENHEILIPLLEDLAKRHNGLGVTRQHLPYAGEALLYAISDALGHGFTDEVRQAWEVVFQLIVDVMSSKLLDGRKTTGIETMTSKQRELVRSTWELIASAPDKHGAVMFAKLVSDNPKAGKLFSFGKKKYPYKKLLNENEVISHGEKFMSTMGQVVGGLEDPEFLVPMLHQLATRHLGYGVTKDLFVAGKSALMFTLKQGLGKSVFSSEVQEAWTQAYQFIEDTMFEKL